jgi:AcrR family transcriptional regulator
MVCYQYTVFSTEESMGRHTQRDWLVAGLRLLASHGSQAITLERLCAHLEVTKGSFYHHFSDVADFKTHLLAFVEEEGTHAIIRQVETAAPLHQKLDQLLSMTLHANAPLEVALRTWALQDVEARQVQERIDAQRLTYLDTLCRAVVPDQEQATVLAQLLYTVYVGSQQRLPSVSEASLQDLYRVCLQAFGLP